MKDLIENHLNTFCRQVHQVNVDAGWWTDLATGGRKDRNIGELLMLCVSELAEAMEGERKGLMDEKLPHYPAFAVELADCVIRIADLAGSRNIPLGTIIAEKMEYNANRADHKIENRMKEGGKKF